MYQPSIEEIIKLFGNDCLRDVIEEVDDPRFGNRQHGSRATFALGCHGPLCRKVERDRSRRRNETRALKSGRSYSQGAREYDRDDLLNAILKWHKIKLMHRRIEELSA